MSLRFATRLLLFFFLFFGGLYFAKGFLIPVAFAGVLAMLLLPIAAWFEKKGAGKSMATALSVLTFLLLIAGLFALLGIQMKSLMSDMGNMEQKITQSVSSAQTWLTNQLGLEGQESGSGHASDSAQSQQRSSGSDSAASAMQDTRSSQSDTASLSAANQSPPQSDTASGITQQPQSSTDTSAQQSTSSGSSTNNDDKSGGSSLGTKLKETLSGGGSGNSSGGGGLANAIQTLPAAILSFLTDAIITLVYLFLFLRFRLHFKRFVIKLTPEPDRRTALEVMHQASAVTQKYLSGMGMMIVCLWVMYGIGFSIVGVKGALFFAVLCGTLELVPFIGNLAGTALTLLVSLTQSGDKSPGTLVFGIIATYFVVQTIQSYLLEPLVVGKKVKLHPAFTILVIILGEMIWGIPGMFLSVPLLGIAKIICDRVPALQPYGYLIGEEENAGDPGWKEQLHGKLSRIFRQR